MSSFPQSFLRDGFVDYSIDIAKRKRRRLMIGSEGESESGKTEFIASAPGPGLVLCLDRGHEAMLENSNPPSSRRKDFLFHVIKVPLETQVHKPDFLKAWLDFKSICYKAISNPDCLTVGIDTDNVSWELQQLSDFGKLTQIPPIMRTGVNAARRAFIAKLYDSGKNIIATNMLKDEYKAVVDDEGNPVLKEGKETQEKTGERRRAGFSDQSYLWQVQIRHMAKAGEEIRVRGKEIKIGDKVKIIGGRVEKQPTQYGIRILKCKVNSELVGAELWGKDCNFAGLVRLMYPKVPLSDWGYQL